MSVPSLAAANPCGAVGCAPAVLHCLHLLLPLRLAVDGVFEEGGEEEETDELVGQVLDEIGINLNASLVSAPGQKVAAAAPAAAAQQPVAQPMGAAEGERSRVGGAPAAGWTRVWYVGVALRRSCAKLMPSAKQRCTPDRCTFPPAASQQAAAARRQG